MFSVWVRLPFSTRVEVYCGYGLTARLSVFQTGGVGSIPTIRTTSRLLVKSSSYMPA